MNLNFEPPVESSSVDGASKENFANREKNVKIYKNRELKDVSEVLDQVDYIYVETYEQYKDACKEIMKETMITFDTEVS